MALELNGTTGVSLVQDGVITDANLPTGSVLQVVEKRLAARQDVSGNAFTATNLSQSITPSFTTSKILVTIHAPVQKENGNASSGVQARITVNGTPEYVTSSFFLWDNTTDYARGTLSIQYLHSPATTSSTTYGLDICNNASGVSVSIGFDGSASSLTLMEIAG